MSKSILVVDDEAKIRRMIKRYLVEKQYILFEAEDGREALEIVEDQPIDLVILDLMMPRLDGEGFIRAVRRFSDVYVIVLTAMTGEDAQVYYYSIGADDYIEKPFSCKALVSKVAAVLSRLDRKGHGVALMQVEGVTIDDASRKVLIDGNDCELKPKEYKLLNYLIINQNIVLSREQILNGVWSANYFGGDRTVDIHISNLRKKLGRYGRYIQTVTGCGYKFEVKK